MSGRVNAFPTIAIIVFSLISHAVNAGFDEAEAANRAGDREKAYVEYQAAGEAGDIRAFGKLGSMYLYGLGTKKDYTKAYVWFGIAVESGDKAAERFQEAAASTMTVEQIRLADESLKRQREIVGLHAEGASNKP